MALFGDRRDTSLLYHINKELIQRVIDIRILLYKVDLNNTTSNLYGESGGKVYQAPVYIHCIPSLEDESTDANNQIIDTQQLATFAFYRDILKEVNVVPEVGDIIEFDSTFYEIDNTNEREYFMGRNNESNFSVQGHGHDIAIVCSTHRIRHSSLNLTQIRSGNNNNIDIKLPKNV